MEVRAQASVGLLGAGAADAPVGHKRAHNVDSASTTALRSVSACKRCRGRKNRCDQKLPACSGCVKAGERCVGFDPGSKRAIPRSYLYYLETRVRSLEARLRDAGLTCPPPEDDFAISDEIRPGVNVPFALPEDGEECSGDASTSAQDGRSGSRHDSQKDDEEPKQMKEEPAESDQHNLEASLSAMPGASGRPLRDATLGVSFARLVRAAVKGSTQKHDRRENGRSARPRPKPRPWESTARDSFFGLVSKPTTAPAPFPSHAEAKQLAGLYFEHANPQIPVLHRGEFEKLLARVYASAPEERSPRELYFLNIVFAIGSGIIMEPISDADDHASDSDKGESASKRRKLDGTEHPHRYQPEQYHASAMPNLERFASSPMIDPNNTSGLEEIQAILLLAGLALLGPVAPGLWYIVGVAMRLAIDLNLHAQDPKERVDGGTSRGQQGYRRSPGRNQWTRDMQRRLWWCVYAFDRLLSTFVNRPFGITDDVITTAFPTDLDDRHISVDGFLCASGEASLPSYKLVAQHYLRLRLLQSEIIQVLQHQHATEVRRLRETASPLECPNLVSPFLQRFESLREWRSDVHRRLQEWNSSAPHQKETGVAFSPLFLELNFWQAVIMLYMPSLAVPQRLTREMSPSAARGDAHGGNAVDPRQPGPTSAGVSEDGQDVFLIMAEAGHRVLKLYFRLHRQKLVNYTFLATHHLFTGCIAFLSAIWYSTLVRSRLTLDDVNTTVNIATSVLGGLAHKCPPAEAYRKAYVRMSKLTIAVVQETTGFGAVSTLASQPTHSSRDAQPTAIDASRAPVPPLYAPDVGGANAQADMQQNDMIFKGLFSEDEIAAYAAMPQQQYQLYHGDRERVRASSNGTPSMGYHHSPSQDSLMMHETIAFVPSSDMALDSVAVPSETGKFVVGGPASAASHTPEAPMPRPYQTLTPAMEASGFETHFPQSKRNLQPNVNSTKPLMGYDFDWLNQHDPARGFDVASVSTEDTGFSTAQAVNAVNAGFDLVGWSEGGVFDQFFFGESSADGADIWEGEM